MSEAIAIAVGSILLGALVELRHGEDRWVGYEDGVVLRRGLRQWYEDAR